MVALNALVAWWLWRQADGLFELNNSVGRALGWLCVAISAFNAAHVAIWISEVL